MKIKFTLVIIAITIFVSNAHAQAMGYGVRAGMNYSTWKGDAVNSFNNVVDITNGYLTTSGKAGWYAGGFINVPLKENFSLEPGVFYSQKGYTLEGNLNFDKLNFLGASAKAQVQSHYIDFPVVIKATIGNGFQVYAGPQVSYLLKDNLHVDAGALGFSLFNRNIDLTNNFNRFDWALVGGIGYKLNNGLSVNAGYDFGLSRLDKNSNFKSYNRTLKLGIGFEF